MEGFEESSVVIMTIRFTGIHDVAFEAIFDIGFHPVGLGLWFLNEAFIYSLDSESLMENYDISI